MNKGIQELLEQSISEKSSKVCDDPTAFKFKEFKDNVGLPMEHLSYVKRNCKACYGRGYQIRLVLGKREVGPCGCIHKGYSKTRRELELRALKTAKQYAIPQEQALALEVGKMGYAVPTPASAAPEASQEA